MAKSSCAYEVVMPINFSDENEENLLIKCFRSPTQIKFAAKVSKRVSQKRCSLFCTLVTAALSLTHFWLLLEKTRALQSPLLKKAEQPLPLLNSAAVSTSVRIVYYF